MKIIERIYVVPGVAANPYIIEDADGLTVIDAGFARSGKKILAYIASMGKSARDVKRIIITHADLDHFGGLAALQTASGARTFASQIEADAIAQGKSSREIKPSGLSARRIMFTLLSPFFKATPFQIHEMIAQGQTLPVLGGLQVLATPGHTPGHISLFLPSVGVLFCDD